MKDVKRNDGISLDICNDRAYVNSWIKTVYIWLGSAAAADEDYNLWGHISTGRTLLGVEVQHFPFRLQNRRWLPSIFRKGNFDELLAISERAYPYQVRVFTLRPAITSMTKRGDAERKSSYSSSFLSIFRQAWFCQHVVDNIEAWTILMIWELSARNGRRQRCSSCDIAAVSRHVSIFQSLTTSTCSCAWYCRAIITKSLTKLPITSTTWAKH